MSSITLTPEQQTAYDAIGEYKSLFLSGAAGCGKSVIITEKVRNDTNDNFVLCALTNQAAKILTTQLNTGIKIPTIHSVLGMVPVHDASTKNSDEITEFRFTVAARNNVNLVGRSLIIDEASMICKTMQEYIFELLEHNNLESVTFVGDRWQLPCVKGNPFDYDMVEHTLELTQINRAKNDLLEYYQEIRKVVSSDDPNDGFELYKNGLEFDNPIEFTEFMRNYAGSKAIITYRNVQADQFSKLMDSETLYIGQECRALSQCSYPHKILPMKIEVNANAQIEIKAIYQTYDLMQRAAHNEEYQYILPNKPSKMSLEQITYAKIVNEDGEEVYVSMWNGYEDSKNKLLLNFLNDKYRKFQDKVKRLVPASEWKQKAKSSGYLKKLADLPSFIYQGLPSTIKQEDRDFWNDFYAIKQALSYRSIFVSTAHRAQGITVDIAGIDINDLDRSESSRLIYVALTRASKNIVFYRGESL